MQRLHCIARGRWSEYLHLPKAVLEMNPKKWPDQLGKLAGPRSPICFGDQNFFETPNWTMRPSVNVLPG